MFQGDLFGNGKEVYRLNSGSVTLYRNFLAFEKSVELFEDLQREINWEKSIFRIHGKSIPVPRLNAWYADEGRNYKYSGISLQVNPWIDSLNLIRELISKKYMMNFNSCLLNLYRDGKDSVQWHADDEPELGRNPTICSISLGEERKFMVRSKLDKNDKLSIVLPHNSALIMAGDFQHLYEHQIPKQKEVSKSRINLTFRNVH